jgi:hypothetical protein
MLDYVVPGGRAAEEDRALLTYEAERERSRTADMDSVVDYLPVMRNRYVRQDNLSLLQATVRAIQQAQDKLDDADRGDLRLFLLPAMRDAQQADVKLSVSITDLEDRDQARASSSGTSTQVQQADSQHYAVELPVTKAAKTEQLPRLGRYVITVQERDKRQRVVTGLYDLGDTTVSQEDRHGVYRIPLFDPSVAALITTHQLPALYLELHLGPGNVLQTTFLSASLLGNPRQVHLAHNYGVAGAGYPQAPGYGGKLPRISLAESAAQGFHANLKSYLSKVPTADGKPLRVASSLSYHGQTVNELNAQESWRVGEAGDLLLALAVIRALGDSGSESIERALHNSDNLRRLLEATGSHQVIRGLQQLYQHQSLPTLHQLITHTSGLPNYGSLDALFFPEGLDILLPSSNKNPELNHPLAKQLAERTTLVAEPGSLVHPSLLGYAVLMHCVPNPVQSFRALFSEFGMVDSKLERHSGAREFTPHSIVTTAGDMGRFLAAIERSTRSSDAHRHLGYTVVGAYMAGRRSGITHGGWNVSSVKIPVPAAAAGGQRKLRLAVLHKIGHDEQGGTILLWVPGLHVGSAAHFNVHPGQLFRQTKKQAGHGRLGDKKLFQGRHLVKVLIRDAVSLFAQAGALDVDRTADALHAAPLPYPPHYSSHLAHCRALPDVPEEGSAFQETLGSVRQFDGDGTRFYPLMRAAQLIHAGGGTSGDILGQLQPIRIKRVNVLVSHSGGGGGSQQAPAAPVAE